MNNFDINSFLKNIHKKYFGKNLLLFLCGVIISSFTFNLFYQRYNIVVSGTGGLSVLINNYIDFDVSIILLILNLLCLLIGFIFFGWDYALKMLAITFISPMFVKGTSYITNMIDLGNTSLFLVMIILIIHLNTGIRLEVSMMLIELHTFIISNHMKRY